MTDDDEDKVTDDLDKDSDEETLIGLPLTYALLALVGGPLLLAIIIGLLVYYLCCRNRNA